MGYAVRLADGNVLHTQGQTTMCVDFGGVCYVGTFHVVPGHILLILGMSFLGEMSPKINWQQKTVFLRNKSLQTVKL